MVEIIHYHGEIYLIVGNDTFIDVTIEDLEKLQNEINAILQFEEVQNKLNKKGV